MDKNNYNYDKIITIPNIITAGRIVASAAIFGFILGSGITVSLPLAGLTALVGATDLLDGYLARNKGMSSKLGKTLDPIADKFFNWGLGFTLMATGAMPLWPLLIAGRDAVVAGVYYHLQKNGTNLHPTMPAKAKMLFQSVGTVSTLAFGFGTEGLALIAPIFMGAAVATSIPEAVAIKKEFFDKKEELKPFVPAVAEDKEIISYEKEKINEESKVIEKNKVLIKKKTRGR